MMKKKADKPQYNLFQNSMYMIRRAWEWQKSVLLLVLALVVLAVAMDVLRLLVTPMVVAAVEENVPLGELLRTILFFAGGLLLADAATAYVNTNTLLGRVFVRLEVVKQIIKKYTTSSYPNTDKPDFEEKRGMAQQCTSSNNKATEAIWDTMTNLLKNAAGFVIYLMLLSSLELWVASLVLVTSGIGFFVTARLNGWGFRHRVEEADLSRRINYISGRATDYTLAKDVRVFSMQGWLTDMYTRYIRLFTAFHARGEKVYIWSDVTSIVLTLVRDGAAYAYLIYLVVNGNLSASAFLLYFAAIGGFSGKVEGILGTFAQLQRQSLDLSTLREFLEYPEPFAFEDGVPLEPVSGKPYEITLQNVSFRYDEAEKDTLHNINLTIAPGEKLAVVGLNGAGKTTLVKLICGFYHPTAGKVLLNGEDITPYNHRDYYRHFSAVFQDFSWFATTMAENIAQTDTDIDMARVKDCAEKAGLSEKLAGLPNGYDTHVGKAIYEDGAELSGGEAQRLMLARALYKDAPILILDEPTAALDPIAESEMYARYNEFTEGRTAVYISHRLASTRFCDRIILIDEGGIAEIGTHDELLRAGKKYAELFEIQSHYYREGGAFHERNENR